MCGIVACRRSSGTVDYLLSALRRLEYRGYDSAGVALLTSSGDLEVVRSSGRVAALERSCAEGGFRDNSESRYVLGLGHTRWATHGAPSMENAHPHRDCTNRVAVVHNGIIENSTELAMELAVKGHRLLTQVDTEVVAHLIEDRLAEGATLPEALLSLHDRMEGAWALAVIDSDSATLAATTRRSPLLVGIGPQGPHVASDAAAFVEGVEDVAPLDDGDVVQLGDTITWWDGDHRRLSGRRLIPLQGGPVDVSRGAHPDFMSKEIAEQPILAASLVQRLLGGLDGGIWAGLDLPVPSRVRFVGCGTSLHAAAAAARVLQRHAGVPAELLTASEVGDVVHEDAALTVAMSQSGETADVLAALRTLPGPVLAITNSEHSTLARRADAVLTCGAGIEVGVAATKTFTAQVLLSSAVAISLAAHQKGLTPEHWRLVRSFAEVPGRLAEADFLAAPIARQLAEELAEQSGFIFLSRGEGLPYAQEGALKLKELTYRWADAYPAGELKHGPIALVTEGTPVIVIEAGDQKKLAGNIAEVQARGARVLRIGRGSDTHFPVLATHTAPPWGPLEAVLPLQHLARALAIVLGCDPDKPRNLAKSVTVE